MHWLLHLHAMPARLLCWQRQHARPAQPLYEREIEFFVDDPATGAERTVSDTNQPLVFDHAPRVADRPTQTPLDGTGVAQGASVAPGGAPSQQQEAQE